MDKLKLLFWTLTPSYKNNEAEPWENRVPTVVEVMKSDAYDFLVLPGVNAPKNPDQPYNMLADIVDCSSDYSFSYTRHVPEIDISEGLAIAHRYDRWEADLAGGFRLWPPKADRALFCVLYYELDEDKKRTGRAVYVAVCQFRPEAERAEVRAEAIKFLSFNLASRPHPEYPVILAGDLAEGAPSTLYDYVTGKVPTLSFKADLPFQTSVSFQDPLMILHPDSPHITTLNNWRDYEPEGGVRRDFVFFSDGLSPISLDFNYLRTPGGLFPSDHYPQRAVFAFDEARKARVLN